MRKTFALGGVVASIVLIGFGIGSIVVGANGRSEVRSNVDRELIVGTPDMTPFAIAAESKKAGLAASLALPSCSVAGKAINSGSRAKCFASYMRIHTLEATGGKTYSQMGQYLDAKGNPTSDKAVAAIDPQTKKPVANQARQIWVTETALTTALNMAFFAEQVATFAIVMGFALLLSGIGFTVLTLRALMPADARKPERARAATPVPVA